MPLLFFEFLGTTELMVILGAALILFGPRKLPEISRQIGKGLSEFKKASEDFRQTWENEVHKEFSFKDAETDRAMLPEEKSVTSNTIGRGQANFGSTEEASATTAPDHTPAPTTDTSDSQTPSPELHQPEEPTRKRDWL
jgi:TatA/E family protein of Tat protein translocase